MMDDRKVLPHRATGYRPCKSEYIEGLQRIVDEAKEGKVTAFVACAIGPDFANWMVASGAMTRQDRMNLIGQLAGMQAQLWKTEEDSW